MFHSHDEVGIFAILNPNLSDSVSDSLLTIRFPLVVCLWSWAEHDPTCPDVDKLLYSIDSGGTSRIRTDIQALGPRPHNYPLRVHRPMWYTLGDSNPGPAVYKTATLTF